MTAENAAGGRLEAPTWLRVGRRYRAPLLIRQFPPELPFGCLGRLLPTTDPVELTVELHPIPAPEALEILHGARAVAETELSAGGYGAQTSELEVERETAEQFGRAVARRTQELWKVGLRFAAIAPSRPHGESVRSRLAERLSGLGFRTRVPRYEVRSALEPPSVTGGEPRPLGYWHTLPTDGVAALFPFADESIVEPGGILVGLALADASPVFVNRWAHASYSWGLFGTTGAGKSFAAALVALRTRWIRPDVEITILDPLGEFAGFVRALGGSVLRIADGVGGRLNPLDPVTTGGDRREKAGRVGAMLRALFPSLEDAESAALDTAVTRLYALGPEVPTLEDLAAEVERATPSSGRLRTLLDVFRSGSLSGTNGPTTVPDGPGPAAVDFRGVPSDQLPFHLSYVLDWAYGRFRDRPGPKLLIVDEAHLLARHRATAEFLDRIVRHVRHFEGGVLLVSQSPEDFLGHPEGRAVLRNLYATAFLRLPEVSSEASSFFGLTSAEAEWLPKARLPRDAGYSESLWRIGALHLPLAVIAATPEYEFLTSSLGHDADARDGASPTGVL
ncbi:MAG: VirB4 family type IV secretion system protein [Thermoplasmata archaeon]